MGDNSYYDDGGLSVKEIWEKKLTPEQLEGAYKSNVIKYILRAGLKSKDKVKDLEKAEQYLIWWIEEEKKKNGNK